ncbi:MAG: type II secretion system protein [Pseudomonadota bacterium]|nr:type II secretion system protein [Pseudomonadota bacterium]
MIKYKNAKGMTLIELFVLLAILTITAYVSFLSYKPRSKLTQLDYTVSELQNLILALKAYQTVNGTWPDSENSCADPITVLSQVNESGSPTYADVSDFVFQTQMTFQCEPNNTTATLYIDFEILKTDLEYYSRYVHDLEIIDDSDNQVLKVSTNIRPVGGKLNTYLTQAKYGPFQRENEDGTFNEIELETKYAFIEVPEDCKGKEDVTAGFSSQSLCTGVNVRDRRGVYQTRLDIVAVDEDGNEHTMYGRIDIVRTFVIEGWDYSSDKCKYTNNRLNCNSNDQELEGWRVMPIPDSRMQYHVESYFGLNPIFHNMTKIDTNYYDSSVYLNESSIENSIFSNTSLVAVFRQAISSEVARRTNKDFSPRVSHSYWSGEDTNTYFTDYFEYNGFFEFNIYHGFVSCSENANLMFAAVTCSAD